MKTYNFGGAELAFSSIVAQTDQSPQEIQGFSPQPQLPTHLDKLLDQPWNPEASKLIDLWLWYVQQEFELARIANKVGGEG